MTILKIRLPKEEEKYLIENLPDKIDVHFLQEYIFPHVPSSLLNKLLQSFSSFSSLYFNQSQFVQLINVFQKGQDEAVRHQLLLSMATGQKISLKNYIIKSASVNQLNSLIESPQDSVNHRLTDKLLKQWIEDHSENEIVRFLLKSYVTNFWNTRDSADLIISSISGVCHLSSNDICLLDNRYRQLSSYSNYLKCEDIADMLAKYIPYDIAYGFISWFDVNGDGKVDFKEYCCSISSITRGPEPERYKYIHRVLDHTVETSVNYHSAKDVIKDILCRRYDGEYEKNSNEMEFMTNAISSLKTSFYLQLLTFYSDICHLYFGLNCETQSTEYELIKRWEAKYLEYVAETPTHNHFMWLIEMKWWRKWERCNYQTGNSELDEVASSLKNLSKGDCYRKMNPMDNSALFKSSTHAFVFEDRGRLPKVPLNYDNCKAVSEYTFNYFKAKYGPCIVPVYRPVVNGVIDFDIKMFSLYRHKYSTTTTYSINSNDRTALALELDGQAIVFKNTTVARFCLDLATTKRLHVDAIRIWKIENISDEKTQKRSLLEGHVKLDDISRFHALLIELRKPDLSWPEDLAELARGKTISRKSIRDYDYTGLVNVGNSCYMNAALQALCSVDLLKKYFEQGYANWETNAENSRGYAGKLAVNFCKLIQQLSESSLSSFAPTLLRQVLASKHPNLCHEGDQQDAVELLQVLLDGLHEDLSRVKEKVENVSIPDSNGRDDIVVSEEHWNLYQKQNNSIIVDLFHLQLKSCIECQKCLFQSTRFQTELYLHLPVPTEDHIVLNVLFYDQANSMIRESKISVSRKATTSQLSDKVRLEGKIGDELIFAVVKEFKFDRVMQPNDLVKTVEQFIAYPDKRLEYNIFASHRTINTNSNARFRMEKFTFFGKPIFIQCSEKNKILDAIQNELLYLLRNEPNISRKSCSAEDCDDLMKEAVPYRIVAVQAANHGVCATCSWENLCTGCDLSLSTIDSVIQGKTKIVVHWETLSLHFKYKEPRMTKTEYQNAGKDFDVVNCLKMFEQSEKVEEWKCDKCESPQTALKQLMPYRFPPVLIIHLKRFELNMYTMKWVKCSKDIKVQTQLEIHDQFSNTTLFYTLFAAIIHQGSLDGGHYTALCYRNSKWILCNDDQIHEVESGKITEYLSNAYVLFYSRHTNFEAEIKPNYDPQEFKDLESIVHKENAPKSSCSIQ